MAGLDVIINQINMSSKSRIDEIQKSSDAECAGILNEAQSFAEKKRTEAEKRAERNVQEIKERAGSTAQLKIRQAVLACKQELIAATLEKAKESFYKMADAEYFNALVSIVETYATNGKGELYLSDKDLKRVPADFEGRINELAKKKGGELKLSADSTDIDGGFILKYDSVEENCSITALFDNSHEILVDLLQKLLFSKK